MMKCFVIVFTRGMMLAESKIACPVNGAASGWRPIYWTRAAIDAEKFMTAESAERYAQSLIPHSEYGIAELSAIWPTPQEIA